MSVLDLSPVRDLGTRHLRGAAGLAFVIGAAITLGAVAGALPWRLALLAMAGVMAVPAFLYGFIRLDIGILLTLTIGFFVEFVRKYTEAPIGVALDGLMVVFAVAMLAGLAQRKAFPAARHPISVMVLVWIYYCGVQFLNPEPTAHRMAWLYTVRSLAGLLFFYFVAVHALDTLPKVKRAIKVILVLGFVSGLYGLKQEFVGFSAQELTWLYADEKRFELINQWSRLRIFSFFSEPTTCGIVMAYLSAMSVVLLSGPFKLWQKVALGLGIVVMVACMGYAGSRTPIVVFPVGVAFFVLMRPRKPILLAAAVLFTFGTLAMMKSSGNPVLHRIQSSFRPTEDASMQLRLENQRMVQPFMRQHPLGTGLGTTGVWGRRFVPEFWGAYFAHDSGLVRIAMEAGYIGLVLYLFFLGTILISGIRAYFRSRDDEIRTLILGIVVVIFCLTVASYPQEAIPMLPTSLVFYVLLACLVRLTYIDAQARAAGADAQGLVGTASAKTPRATPPPLGLSAVPTRAKMSVPAAMGGTIDTIGPNRRPPRVTAPARQARATTADTHQTLPAREDSPLRPDPMQPPASTPPPALPGDTPTEADVADADAAALAAWRARWRANGTRSPSA